MQLFLGLVVLSEIGVIIREAIEILDKLFQNALLSITRVEELQELSLEFGLLASSLLALEADVAENTLHLALVIAREISPHLDNDRLEVAV